MSGKNKSLFDLPPGFNRTASQYSAGPSWWSGNLVRWFNKTLTPIGGWVKQYQLDNFAEKALANYTNGIAFSFQDLSCCIKSGGAVVYSGPLNGTPGINMVGNIRASSGGCYMDTENYVTLALGSLNLPENYATACTQMVEFSFSSLPTANPEYCCASTIYNASDLDISYNIHAYLAATNTPAVRMSIDSSGSQFSQSSSPWVRPTLNTNHRLASAYALNNGNSSYDNVLEVLDTALLVPTVYDTIVLGRARYGAYEGLRGKLLTAIFLPERLADSALQAWSNLPVSTYPEPIRNTHSWRDLLKNPWAVYGSANKLWASAVEPTGTYTFYDITPTGLGYNPGGIQGYGSGDYGEDAYGISASGSITLDANGLWSLDNFGKMLVGVASQDGRLVVWDPDTPNTPADVVPTAPIDNTLVIATDEEFVMLMGGKNNPRRVKWASRRTYTDWTPTATNSAGGFELQTNGAIKGACRVPGGILVLTDTDAHLIEYVGAPFYYGRRRISDETELVSAMSLFSMPFGAVWMGANSFWSYSGNVNKLPCTVELDAFYNSDLSSPHLVHGGINQYAQEVWWFYPSQDSPVPNRYVLFSYNQSQGQYWASGSMERTAWLNPIWQTKPIGVNNQTIYQQETGDTADGDLRGVFAETGAMEIEDGDRSYRLDRVYPDLNNYRNPGEVIDNLTMSFTLKQAPNTTPRVYGPVPMYNPKGYVTVRMRARQIALRIDEIQPGNWSFGKARVRVKEAGAR